MLAVNYKNLLKNAYPEIPKILNLETAAYLYGSTCANVSILTFYMPWDLDFIKSGYLVGLKVKDFDDIPTSVLLGRRITTPIRTLQDLFNYEELVDPQVTFDYVSWFEASQKLDPCDYLDEKYHKEARAIVKEGWSHGYR